MSPTDRAVLISLQQASHAVRRVALAVSLRSKDHEKGCNGYDPVAHLAHCFAIRCMRDVDFA